MSNQEKKEFTFAVKSIDKQRLGDKLGKLDQKTMLKVDEVLVKLFSFQHFFNLWP